MQRGDVITVAERGGDFTGKPRPAVIVQSDLFAALDSVTICPLTSMDGPAVTRVRIAPSRELPLDHVSWVAVDKITTVRRQRIGQEIGRLSPSDLQRILGALLVFVGAA
jgi:mRNA interferase MazF